METTMTHSRIAGLARALACLMPLALLPAAAQTQPAPPQPGGAGTRVGTLRCDVAGSTAFIFGSTRTMTCDFSHVNGTSERYTGEINRYGVDIGFQRSAVMLWGVVAPSPEIGQGGLAGNFVGVSGGATVGVGVGANILVGGARNNISLQPISIEGNTGLNLALGVAELELRVAR
jgi:hypothetical protein